MKNDNRPYIGSYVLESLTTGMYGESRNALREYIQNAFDAIRAAVNVGVLEPNEGSVYVLLPDENTIIITDNGIGLSKAAAAGTLISIGASKKDRSRDAGFRGIGRLAGIAFCNTLTFTTKITGEDTETSVSFNCKGLRQEINSGGGSQELVELLQEQVKVRQNKVDDIAGHYMQVKLQGLSNAPDEFKNLSTVRDYLTETSPIDFDPAWEQGRAIKAVAKKYGKIIEHIKLFVGHTPENMAPLYKAYTNSYALKGGTSTINEIEYHRGKDWWAWVGLPDRPAMIEDPLVHGLRVRVKNIQLDGGHIFDDLFGQVRSSYVRFNKYYVGEVHIDPGALVPNARRDGFEDDIKWTKVKQELKKICGELAITAYELSSSRQKELEKLKKNVERIQKVSKRINIQSDAQKRISVLNTAFKIRDQIVTALNDANSETKVQLKQLIDSVDSIRNGLDSGGYDANRESRLRTEIEKEVIARVLAILEPHLEPRLFVMVKKKLNTKT